MPLDPGTTLGAYEIIALEGEGGMGEVYRARDTRLDRTVALKVLRAELTANSEVRQRFDREARAISGLNHPNICVLYDVGHEDGIDFLVMEYLEGESLAEFLKRNGPMSPDEMLPVAGQLVDALAAAHARGVVHRDIKPGNIMLTSSGPKLLDFGLARDTGLNGPAGDLSISPTISQPLTVAGTILGTFQYMSPEQLEGKDADSRSDIYSLGAVFYEMLTGRPTFTASSHASLIASVLKEEPSPVRSFAPLASPGLERLVRRCLAKDPNERWQTTTDLRQELTWIAEGGGDRHSDEPSSGRNSREFVAWGVTALAIALAGWAFLRTPDAPTAPVAAAPLVKFEMYAPAEFDGNWECPRPSPDGTRFAIAGRDSLGASSIWIRNLGDVAVRRLAGTEGAGRPFWSPDGTHLAFFADDYLRKIDVGRGDVKTICFAPNGADGDWSRSDVIVFDGRQGDSLLVVPAAGGTPRGASYLGENRIVGWPEFLPDGRRFLFVRTYPDSAAMYLGELDTFDTRYIGPTSSRVELAGGRIWFVHNGLLVSRSFDEVLAVPTGETVPAFENFSASETGMADFALSESGTLVTLESNSVAEELRIVDRTGHVLDRIGVAGEVESPDLTRDQRRVVVHVKEPHQNADIWMFNLADGSRVRLTSSDAHDEFPRWSADESKVLFTRRTNGLIRSFYCPISRARNPQRLLQIDQNHVVCQELDDGRYLAMVQSNSQWDIGYAAPSDTAFTVIVATPGEDLQPSVSPDGRWLAYAATEVGGIHVYVTDFPDGNKRWRVSEIVGAEPMWSADGRTVTFLDHQQRLVSSEITVHDGEISAGPPVLLFPAPIVQRFQTLGRYAQYPDGERFMLVCPRGALGARRAIVVMNWSALFDDGD